MEAFIGSELKAFLLVIAIDLVMSGDNAIVIGIAANSLPPELRKKAIFYGILGATVLRILFASITVQLLEIIGLTLAGGLLLTWVCWQMWVEIRQHKPLAEIEAEAEATAAATGENSTTEQPSIRKAMRNIILADLSMSLDNVLAVAGAARDHLEILIFGLVLSIALMAVASTFIANLLDRHHWISYIGLAVIAYVAGDMIWRGGFEVHSVLVKN
ncbi:MAG: TerC family protein [Rhodospirillales bacterium]|jgi:YjbE family integral membrane protein